MFFPEAESLDERQSIEWVEKYLHPRGLRCPGCDATTGYAREFRVQKRGSVDYRCRRCQSAYNLYTSTIFSGSNLEPRTVLLLLRGMCRGATATVIAKELSLSRQCVQRWRKRIRDNAYALLSDAARSKKPAADGMFQSALRGPLKAR
jgi:transposase-like protein